MKKLPLDIDLSGPDLNFHPRKEDRRKNDTRIRGEFFIRQVGDRTVFGKNRRKASDRRNTLIDTSFVSICEVGVDGKSRKLL